MEQERVRDLAEAMREEGYRKRLREQRPPIAVWTRLMNSIRCIAEKARAAGHTELADELSAATKDSMAFWRCDDWRQRFDIES